MEQQRVLIISQYFHPEYFKISELAFELKNRGYNVDVLTGIPNYPEGKYKTGYGLFKKRIEEINGVKVYRAFHTPRGKKASSLGLSINYISFLISSIFWILFYFSFKKKYNSIIAYQVSPITQVVPAIILGKLRKVKVYTWVQDIWPDSVISTFTGSTSKILSFFLNPIVDYVYKHSDKLLISSKGFTDLICRRGDYRHKISYLPNWCDDILTMPKEKIPNMPEGFIIMMAGNLAEGIGIESVEKCVECMSDLDDVNFVFVGGGAYKDEMKEYFKINNLNNAHVLGHFPFAAMSSFYDVADAMFLSLRKVELQHYEATVPSRLQSYMAAGKPIFAMIGKGASEIIKEADAGFVVPAGDYKQLEKIIREKYKDRELLKEKGNNARKYYMKNFTLPLCVDMFEKEINN